MFDTDQQPDVTHWLTQFHTLLDTFAQLPLEALSDDQFLTLWRDTETLRRRLAPIDHTLIGHAQTRHLPAVWGARTLTTVARDVLRIGAGEAAARIRATDALGPRQTLTGQPLPPIYSKVAAAQADGTVAEPAAKVITQLIDRLPDQVRATEDQRVEQFLVHQATVLDVDALRQVARRLEATLDPDGLLKDTHYRTRHRDLRFQVRPDGSCRGEFEGTAEFTEWLRTLCDVMATPRPETHGLKDPRTAGQRRHDGLLASFKLLARANQLPTCAGITTTVILTLTDQALTTGQGTATTGHGVLIPATEARRWIGGDTRIFPVRLGPLKQIQAYGTNQRLFTQAQRLAMIARDGGCAFPGCTAPPQWTQAHHVIPYADGGPTTVASGVLLCDYDHDHHETNGWHCIMLDEIPHWIPPKWRDPHQTPIRNHAHNPQAE